MWKKALRNRAKKDAERRESSGLNNEGDGTDKEDGKGKQHELETKEDSGNGNPSSAASIKDKNNATPCSTDQEQKNASSHAGQVLKNRDNACSSSNEMHSDNQPPSGAIHHSETQDVLFPQVNLRSDPLSTWKSRKKRRSSSHGKNKATPCSTTDHQEQKASPYSSRREEQYSSTATRPSSHAVPAAQVKNRDKASSSSNITRSDQPSGAIHHSDQTGNIFVPPRYPLSPWKCRKKRDVRYEQKTLIFRKALFASAVNRRSAQLVIPKGIAESKFPSLQKHENSNNGHVMLRIVDNLKKQWQMKLSLYSGQIEMYVLRSGWREFVSCYNLQVNDVVSFYETDNSIYDKCYHITWERPEQARNDAAQCFNNRETGNSGAEIADDYSENDGSGSETSEDTYDACDPDYDQDYSDQP